MKCCASTTVSSGNAASEDEDDNNSHIRAHKKVDEKVNLCPKHVGQEKDLGEPRSVGRCLLLKTSPCNRVKYMPGNEMTSLDF